MRQLLIVILLCFNAAYAGVKSYDLEVQTMSDDTPMQLGQLQVKPTVTFALAKKVDLTAGAIVKFQDNKQPNEYGLYTKFTYRPH
jgi:hypothetical protein